MTQELLLVTSAMTILPKGHPIFSDHATTISIEDDAGGPFFVISQDEDEHGEQKIRLTLDEIIQLHSAAQIMSLHFPDLEGKKP